MTAESTLPSEEEALQSLKKIHQDSGAWRDIVTTSIQYATNSSSIIAISSSDDSMQYDEGRVTETVHYLLKNLNNRNVSDDVAHEIDSKMGTFSKDNTTTINATTKLREMAESILVDALWLAGTMLEPQTQSGGDSQNNEKDEGASKILDTYAALCKLTLDLTKSYDATADGKKYKEPLTPIPRRKLLTSLEPRHLNSSGILSDQFLQLFMKKIRKLNTDMYYRQKKVNLMQEESEGYAKFLRFLVNLPQVKDIDVDVDYGMSTNDTNRDDIIQLAKLRITELIGTFDLDPNRCLDLILDSMEGSIRESLPASAKLQKGQAQNFYHLMRHAPGSAMTIHVLLHIIKLFPVENVTHLIGFKFSSYAKSTQKETPQSLYLATVVLASHRLLSLPGLKPHLPPLKEIDDSFISWKQQYRQKIRKLGVVSLNSSKKETKATDESRLEDLNRNKNQTIQLFRFLLEIGIDWNFSIGIFGADEGSTDACGEKRNECLKINDIIAECCCLYTPLGLTFCDILLNAIAPIYDAKITNIGSLLCQSKEEEGEVASANGEYSLLPVEMLNTKAMELDANLTLVEMLEAVNCLLEPIVTSGCMASSKILYTKLCRLTNSMLLESEPNRSTISEVDKKVLEFMENVLVSSLSLFPLSPAIASELWSVLSLLPYQIRYALYSSCRERGLEKAALSSAANIPKPLAQIESEVNTSISTKYLLRRMSKDNIKDMGRQVSKVAHNNPLVVFTLILNQIESYDNLILIMVDTFKFMGALSLDVMGYCLLVSLGGEGEGRSKMKDDGVNTAQWLSSLETFAGAFYKKFTDVELHGLLTYFMRRLNDGHILELGVLQSLLKMTGGYGFADSGSSASLSQVQLDGRCGSLVLRKETSDFGIVEVVNVRSSRRLRSSLQHNNCGVTFLILLSQLRARVIYDQSRDLPKQIKLIGNLYDICQRTLQILLLFLTDGSQDFKDSSSSKDAGAIAIYAKVLPTIGELGTKFGISTADAWTLCRPLIRAALFAEEEHKKFAEIPAHLQPFHPASENMISAYHGMLPSASWIHISPLLFHRFYSYSIYDLANPEEKYVTEIARIKREIDRLKLLQKGGRDAIGIQASMASAVAAAGGTERDIRKATAFTKEHSIELDRLNKTSETLSIDMKRQKKHSQHVHNLLKSEKDQFFASGDGSMESASVFFTTCLYPRILLSPEDAMYCSRFIMLLHNIDTPGFFTLQILDVVISAVTGTLYSTTEDEAGCLGIFLNEQWKTISGWRYGDKLYEMEVVGKHGSIKNEISSNVAHSEFIEIYNKWHSGLGLAFIGCLKSSEYMHTRTALIILTKMVDFFPTKSTLGEKLLEALVPLQEDTNPMQDIKAMAQGYSSKIIIARDNGRWKEEDIRITKAREEREKKIQLDRKINAKKQLEEMEKEMADSVKKSGDQRLDRKPHDRRTQPRFTPAPKSTVESIPQSHGDRNGRGQDSRGHKEQNVGMRNEARSGDRWERTGPEGSRGTKRGRSPDTTRGVSDRGRLSERDRDRGRRNDGPRTRW